MGRTTPLLRVIGAVALLGLLGVAGCARQTPQTPHPTVSNEATGATTSTPAMPGPPVVATSTSSRAVSMPLCRGEHVADCRAGEKTSKAGGIPRPADKTAADEAVRLLHESQDIGKVQSIAVRGMTQDSKGQWWVLVAITDDLAGSDQAVLTYNGKSWDVMVFGEGVSNDDLPPDVRF